MFYLYDFANIQNIFEIKEDMCQSRYIGRFLFQIKGGKISDQPIEGWRHITSDWLTTSHGKEITQQQLDQLKSELL